MAHSLHHKNDKELLSAFYVNGDTEQLGILLQRYTALLLGVCMKYLKNETEAKDAVQQIFLKVISELHKYEVDYFKSWLYMVAKNYCLMKLRDRKKTTLELTENLNPADDENLEKFYIQQKEASLNNLEKALHLLNEEQRICITLFYLDKKSYQEISHISGYNALQVKSNIQNGKRNLKIIMQRMASHDQ